MMSFLVGLSAFIVLVSCTQNSNPAGVEEIFESEGEEYFDSVNFESKKSQNLHASTDTARLTESMLDIIVVGDNDEDKTVVINDAKDEVIEVADDDDKDEVVEVVDDGDEDKILSAQIKKILNEDSLESDVTQGKDNLSDFKDTNIASKDVISSPDFVVTDNNSESKNQNSDDDTALGTKFNSAAEEIKSVLSSDSSQNLPKIDSETQDVPDLIELHDKKPEEKQLDDPSLFETPVDVDF